MTWPVRPLGDIAETALGKMLDRGKPRGHEQVLYLRNINVQWGRVDTDDLLSMELADGERERFGVREGDLLVCEGGEIGRCAIWPGHERYISYQKALHRIRPSASLDARFLRYLLEHHSLSGTLAGLSTGTTIAHLSQQQLRRVPVPQPLVEEQRRIVDLLEDHLSRLDAADAYLDLSEARLRVLRERLARDAITGADAPERCEPDLVNAGTTDGELPSLPREWNWARLGDVADVVGGVTKDAKKQGDPSFVEVPYLRVANVQRGHLRLDDVSTIPVDPQRAHALVLEPGDVLLNEGGDRDKLARGWVWEGEIDGCIHQNHVFRARIREPNLDPYFLSWTANTIGGRWAEQNGKQSVNLASISLSMIKNMPVIVPAAGEAKRRVAILAEQVLAVERLNYEIVSARSRMSALRRSLLAAAFSGRLTGDSLEDADRGPA